MTSGAVASPVLAVLAFSCLALTAVGETPQPVVFTDVTREAGITFVNAASPEKRYIVESMGGGVAFFDFDADHRLDILLLNSRAVNTAPGSGCPPAALYRNRGDGTFEEVAGRAGIADPGWAMGVSVADYDNDGLDDVYVTCFGPNRLYRNSGDGTFEDVSRRAGVADERFSTGSAWGDYDRDGDLDLFVSNYVAFSLTDLPEFGKGPLCRYQGVPVQCGPRGLPGAGDTLYRNNGNGTFSDVSEAAGVDDAQGMYGLTAVWTDFDNDGWPDIFVANDATPNFLYRNNRDGTFEEVALPRGVAVSEDGLAQGSMGVSWGDYDRDGLLDLVVTNFSREYNTIYRRNAEGDFSDVTRSTETAEAAIPLVGWGTRFLDYDNDGWLDLFVANGHVYPQIDGAYPGGRYRQRKLLYRNLRDGTFTEIAGAVGKALLEPRASRGAAFGDFDGDGDLDIVVNDLDGPPMLLRNDGGSKAGNWLRVELRGTVSNRNAIGARVELSSPGVVQIEEVRGTDSYLSHSEWQLHFGLGSASTVERLSVRWPSGRTEIFRDLAVNRTLRIAERKGD